MSALAPGKTLLSARCLVLLLALGFGVGATPPPTVKGAGVALATGDSMPVATSVTNPRYPASLRKAGISGTVVMRFIVTDKGRVQAGSIVAVSSPDPLFSKAAADAVIRWRFKPATKAGVPITAWMEVPIGFKIP